MRQQSTCGADHCITCSDEGVPMRVNSVNRGRGVAWCVNSAGDCREVMTSLVADVREGDVLLVHAGTALARLSVSGIQP